jgi:glycine hydroxymethyltransferase
MTKLTALKGADPDIYAAVMGEAHRQTEGMELIASENYISEAVLETMGTVFNNKYAEGYPGRRYYGGQTFTDEIENIARDRATKLFRADHANVQPHAGAPMNVAAYFALMEPGDNIIGMDLSHGGHLTHGHPLTYLTKIFNFYRYKMKDVETGELDYEELDRLAGEVKPKVLLVGFSTYPREVDYARVREIADKHECVAMADVAHIAGMIAGGALENPLDHGFDVVTTTTHKSLRGPRGGMILCKEEYAKAIDKSVFPGFQGGPIMQMIAAKAVAFKEAMKPEFKEYAHQVIKNSKAMAQEFMDNKCKLVTNGTDNHMMLIDTITSFNLSGKVVEQATDKVEIALNKNIIADDPRKPLDPSGIRVGTPAMTTRGVDEKGFQQIARWIIETAQSHDNESRLLELKKEVREFCLQYPLPGTNE